MLVFLDFGCRQLNRPDFLPPRKICTCESLKHMFKIFQRMDRTGFVPLIWGRCSKLMHSDHHKEQTSDKLHGTIHGTTLRYLRSAMLHIEFAQTTPCLVPGVSVAHRNLITELYRRAEPFTSVRTCEHSDTLTMARQELGRRRRDL